MTNKTRKHLWPVSLVMSIGIIGALAAFLVLASNPGDTQAHGASDHPSQGWPACADMTDAQRAIHNGIHENIGSHGTMDPCPTPGTGTPGTDMPATGDMITSDSTSGGAAPEFQVVIDSLPTNLAVGSSIVLYLEDDYQEPATIPASSVYFVASPPSAQTGNGARVYTIIAPNINTDAYFDADKKDISIRVFIPDMCTNATDACEGPNGPTRGQKLTMVVEDSSGIKNPTEQGSHSAAFAIVGPTDGVPGPAAVNKDFELPTWAKISLSDVDNIRDYELTITGSGFNNGTTASAYVLQAASAPMDAAGDADCAALVADPASTRIGSGLVGSDDKVVITAEVTVPTFGAGNVNQICMVDGENRYSSDIDDFKLEPSIKVVPSSVNSGDTVNVFAQDYPAGGGGFVELKLAGQVVNSRPRPLMRLPSGLPL